MIAIGIDTGGTCTDAVLYDLSEKRVLSFAKSPTTHGRLEDGITAALRSLDQDLVKEADSQHHITVAVFQQGNKFRQIVRFDPIVSVNDL